jgi:hypothetical protein
LPELTRSSGADNFYLSHVPLFVTFGFPAGVACPEKENITIMVRGWQLFLPVRTGSPEGHPAKISTKNAHAGCRRPAALKPEPLHHDKGILAIGIVLLKSEDLAIAESPVKHLRGTIGNTHFQLDTGSQFKSELVLDPADKEFSYPPVPIPLAHPDVAEVAIDILSGIFKSSHNKPGHDPVADRHETGGGVICKGFKKDGLVPGIDKRIVLDGGNCRDIRYCGTPDLRKRKWSKIMGPDHRCITCTVLL